MTPVSPSAHDLLVALDTAALWADTVRSDPDLPGLRVKLAEKLTEARTAEAAYRGDGTSPITDAIQRSVRGKR